ncbi:MAG: alpha/beta hydrolase [Proteobacteria bacterium]|nr:alpha/beta hydrolase [Pseudomonadota bacterium]
MPQVTANGITIEYDERGNPDHPPLLLIMGFGQQMVAWPDPFCNLIAEQGFRVIRFDNRDTGFTQKFEEFGVPDFADMLGKVARGEVPDAPYTLEDMADDAAGLLQALDIEAAHIVGASMGGMIAQLVAIRHTDRVLSLTSIMSSSNRPGLRQATPVAAAALFDRPTTMDRDAISRHAVKTSKAIGSPGYPLDEAKVKAFAGLLFDRMFYPQGAPRQYAGILATPPRWEKLRDLDVPTLVIHGVDDPLIPVDNGEDSAALIPGAKLEIIEGMGHNLPPQLYSRLIGLMTDHAKSALQNAA